MRVPDWKPILEALALIAQFDTGRSREGRPLSLSEQERVEKARQTLAAYAMAVVEGYYD